AFISGTLSDEERQAVLTTLLWDDEAREWLHMACEALAAARQERPSTEETWRYAVPRAPMPGPDRPARRYVHYPPGLS
ncbi:MAG: hypothetical protein D6746_08035, partial [Bacteroidetes bacterium]